MFACALDLGAIRIIWYWAEARITLPLAVTAVIAALTLWVMFAAPRAVFRIPIAGQLAVKGLLYAIAIAGAVAGGNLLFGVVLGLLALVSNIGLVVSRPR